MLQLAVFVPEVLLWTTPPAGSRTICHGWNRRNDDGLIALSSEDTPFGAAWLRCGPDTIAGMASSMFARQK
jgi:hypothetical protein